MFKVETLIEILSDLLRAIVVDEVSERVRKPSLSLVRKPRGMAEVRRHIYRQCSRRLLKRLSTKA